MRRERGKWDIFSKNDYTRYRYICTWPSPHAVRREAVATRPSKKEDNAGAVGNHAMQSDFSRWTVAALGAELSARGLSKAGLRGELIERLGQDETEKCKKRKAPTDNGELLTSLECPICMDRIMPPFEQCTNGHVICGVCKPSVLKSGNPTCPECRVSLRSLSRNLLMEKVVSGLTVACKNECGEMHLPYTLSREHERRTCPLAPLQCPHVDSKITYCDFRGDHTAMVAHCKERHKNTTICKQVSSDEVLSLQLALDSNKMEALLAERSDKVCYKWSECVQLAFHGNVCVVECCKEYMCVSICINETAHQI